ncbi:MAG: hypothetical protein JWN86_4369 [Planctomycetota bacterium]|nr:hypothetical protein [Planctomycetota bacterium]
MATVAAKSYLTPAQYLSLERKSVVKHEYRRGETFETAGASRDHNLIVLNVSCVIGNGFVNRPCEAYAANMRVLIESTGLYTYPDVVAVSGEPRFEDSEVDTLLNPTVIVEVLSPSTEAYDRGEKFAQFRTVPSLQEYILIEQDEVRIERFSRRGGQWVLTEWTSLDDVTRLDAIDCDVPLREVYAKVELPAKPTTSDPARQGG